MVQNKYVAERNCFGANVTTQFVFVKVSDDKLSYKRILQVKL